MPIESRPIPGFDGYLATADGRVIGRHGRPLAFYLDEDGYRRVTLASARGKDARRVHVGIHQAVCLAFHGPRPAGMEVRHLDGSKRDHPDNLEWSRHIVNIRDRAAHGTLPRGLRSGKAKLGYAAILEIRRSIANGLPQRLLAKKFSVSQGVISSINRGLTWAYVKEDEYAHP